MLKFIGKRVLMLIPVLIGVSLIVFTLMQLSPGDPAMIILGAQAAPEDIAILRESMGLNDPLIVQFFRFLFGKIGLKRETCRGNGCLFLHMFNNQNCSGNCGGHGHSAEDDIIAQITKNVLAQLGK